MLKAELHIKEDVASLFCKARTVSYALRAAIIDELQMLQDEGIYYKPTICIFV